MEGVALIKAEIPALLALGIAILLGLLSTRIMKKIGLPNVTGYLIIGLIIGPHCLGIISNVPVEDGGLAIYDSLSIISSIALGFIAFSIGVEFKLSHIKEIGKSAITITMFQALAACVFVDLLLLTVLPTAQALILGAIATATAPAATLMVVKQYKAKGQVTGTLLPVVALDDAVGLIVFAISNAIALSLASGLQPTVLDLAVWPLLEIVTSLVVGAIIGFVISLVPKIFKSRDNRLIAAIMAVFMCIGLCELFAHLEHTGVLPFKLSDLLVCMMAGAIFVNVSDQSPKVMEGVDRWTPVLFMVFFILSGAELDVTKLFNWNVVLILALYLIARSAGKYLGTFVGATLVKADKPVRNFLGITLLPQAGVAIGMATMCKNEFKAISDSFAAAGEMEKAAQMADVGSLIVTITMCAVLIYELFGPLMTKWALTKAGEIDPEMAKARKKAK